MAIPLKFGVVYRRVCAARRRINSASRKIIWVGGVYVGKWEGVGMLATFPPRHKAYYQFSIAEEDIPQTERQLRRFLGAVNLYRVLPLKVVEI